MIISHKYKFIFIKTVKTAGTSIEVFLSNHCGPNDVITPILPAVDGHEPRNYEEGGFYNHIAARKVRRRIGHELWNNYYTFCVERNPWDKTLSHYFMERYRQNGKLELSSYFEQQQFCVNYPLYTNQMGEPIVDEVLSFENLSGDLGRLFSRLGIPFDGDLGVRAKSEYRTDHRPYKEVLSSEQLKQIEDVFSHEIKMHDFQC